MKNNCLITSAGTGSGFATAECINKYFNDKINLFISDINSKNLVSSSIFTDNFFQSPSVYDSDYKKKIINYIKSNEIRFCIPFIDIDIKIFSELAQNKDINEDVYLQVRDIRIANICADKYLTYNWLTKNKINTPKTYILNENIEFENVVIKPKLGFGSQIKIVNKSDIYLVENQDKYIAQEICNNPEITVDVFKDKNTTSFYILCRERIETKSGVCTKARVFYDEMLYLMAQKISFGLGLNYFCFQVMDLRGEWAVTDINPRFGAGTTMGQEVGMDFYAAMVANIFDLEYHRFLKQFKSENFITRQYRNILSK